jgi:ParB-like chromosome segregation protein Spo0J
VDVIERLSPDDMIPRNPVIFPEKRAELERSMRARGWQGRPLVAVAIGRRVQAVTGSHRIYAARAAGLRAIPVEVIRAGSALKAVLASDGWSARTAKPHDAHKIANDLARAGQARLAQLVREG